MGRHQTRYLQEKYFDGLIEKLKIHEEEIEKLSSESRLDKGFVFLVDDIEFTYTNKDEHNLKDKDGNDADDTEDAYIPTTINGRDFLLRRDSFENPKIKTTTGPQNPGNGDLLSLFHHCKYVQMDYVIFVIYQASLLQF